MFRRALLAVWMAVLALSSALPQPASAQNATLLRDVNNDPFDLPRFQEAGFRDLTAAGGKLWFFADAEESGSEVWVSDGTSAGTEALRDGCPGPCSAPVAFLGGLGGLMLWTESAGGGLPVQLWRSDGSRPGTFPLTADPLDLRRPVEEPDGATAFFDGAFYFTSCAFEEGVGDDCDLWRTDGTLAGTRAFHDEPRRFGWLQAAGGRLFYLSFDGTGWELWMVARGGGAPVRVQRFPTVFEPHAPVFAGGRLTFFVRDPVEGEEVWSSDGTAAGTRRVTQFAPLSPFRGWLKAAGGRVYFTADDGRNGREIWRTDGTPAGTVRLTNFSLELPFADFRASSFALVGERLLFFALDGGGDLRLWASRGTPATTAPLPFDCDECEFQTSGIFHEAGGRAFFLVDREFRPDLWVTDGTTAGTRALLPACEFDFCDFSSIAPLGSGLAFFVDRSDGEVWTSDGTVAGTRRLLRLDFDESVGDPLQIADLGGRRYFLIEGRTSSALWAGEAGGGRRPVRVVSRSRPSSSPSAFTAVGDRLLFVGHASDFDDISLWGSRGTPESTFRFDLPDLSFENDPEFTRAGGLTYFRTGEFFDPINLWRTDGTPEGTFVVAHLHDEAPLGALGGKGVFFDGGWIWRTDGTVAGTVKTGDVPAEIVSIRRTVEGPNGLYLEVTARSSGSQIWITDGTTAGTRPVTSFGFFNPPGNGMEPTAVGSFLYFIGPGGVWRTDGTAAGTERVAETGEGEAVTGLQPFQGSLYFFRERRFQDPALELWKTDGSPAGAVRLASFFVRERSDEIPTLTPFGGRLFFAAAEGVHGREPWATDGTPAGTVLLRDLVPGPAGSRPEGFTAAGGALYFSAADATHGVELWRSDGTGAGTRLAQDIAPQAGSSTPRNLTVAGDKLYFSADDGLTGREPWVLPLAGAAGCQAASSRLCLGNGRYAVESTWLDPQGNEGVGQAVALTADTGYFWFFAPTNVEAVLKVLDGRGVNGHVWTFYGALSDVEYSLTVTDTETGLAHRYLNPPGQLASVADTHSFGPLGASEASVTTVVSVKKPEAELALVERRVVARAATGACAPSSNRLCLNGGRYAVEVAWKDFAGNTGTGQAVALTADTGYFWFFDAANVELVLKVLDGSAVNGHRWVFYGALSSVEYTVTVTDTETGEIKIYRNSSGNLASVADIEAF